MNGALDLQPVERQPSERGERGMRAAEIVERDFDALAPQPIEGRGDNGEIVDERRLGDLELKPARIEASLVDQSAHGLAQQRRAQLRGREVNRHPQVLGPFRHRPRRLAQRPGTDFIEDGGSFGGGDKLAGVEIALRGAPPAQERLEPRRAPGCNGDQRLKIKPKFAGAQGVAQGRVKSAKRPRRRMGLQPLGERRGRMARIAVAAWTPHRPRKRVNSRHGCSVLSTTR